MNKNPSDIREEYPSYSRLLIHCDKIEMGSQKMMDESVAGKRRDRIWKESTLPAGTIYLCSGRSGWIVSRWHKTKPQTITRSFSNTESVNERGVWLHKAIDFWLEWKGDEKRINTKSRIVSNVQVMLPVELQIDPDLNVDTFLARVLKWYHFGSNQNVLTKFDSLDCWFDLK